MGQARVAERVIVKLGGSPHHQHVRCEKGGCGLRASARVPKAAHPTMDGAHLAGAFQPTT